MFSHSTTFLSRISHRLLATKTCWNPPTSVAVDLPVSILSKREPHGYLSISPLKKGLILTLEKLLCDELVFVQHLSFIYVFKYSCCLLSDQCRYLSTYRMLCDYIYLHTYPCSWISRSTSRNRNPAQHAADPVLRLPGQRAAAARSSAVALLAGGIERRSSHTGSFTIKPSLAWPREVV